MSLIVGVILAYLARTGHRREFGAIWLGVAGAVALSVLAGGVIVVTSGDGGETSRAGKAPAGLTTFLLFAPPRIQTRRQQQGHRRSGPGRQQGDRGRRSRAV